MRISRRRSFVRGLVLAIVSLGLVGCGSTSNSSIAETTGVEEVLEPQTETADSATPETTSTPETAAPPDETLEVATPIVTPLAEPVNPVAHWSLAEQVGALFMVGVSAGDGTCSTQLLGDRHVVGLFLSGRSQHGQQAIAEQVAACRELATAQVPLLVATDQEGGLVQVLQGEGFDRFPSALEQSQDPNLVQSATTMATQLRAAGVDVNFAPVLDLVDESFARNNPPIGAIQRNFGFEPETVAQQVTAFAQGMQNGNVIPTLKHFPGLGRVTVNTDYGSGVVDTETYVDSDSVIIYDEVLGNLGTNLATAPWIMVSTAVYDQMDPAAPAAFSPDVVALARQSGFTGVIITDDLSDADQVAEWKPGDRAINAIEAGVDIVLFSAIIDDVPAAMDAVIARAESDPDFRARVLESATRVAEVAGARTPLYAE